MDAQKPLVIRIIGAVFAVGPLIFAFGFIAPLVTQLLVKFGLPLPDGITPLMVGLGVAALWGGFVQWKGRWI